jgi:polar amino acid transport system substrate-binding protein
MTFKLVRMVLILSVLAVTAVSPALAETIMFDASNPPFMYGEEGGKVLGIYPAILSEAFKRMGVPLETMAVPWKRAISAIDEGSAGVGGIYKNEERLKKYDYSDKLFDEVILVYVKKASPFDYKDVGSLSGKRVGVLRGWSYGDDFDGSVKANKITVDEAENDAQNFSKLAAGRIDAVLAIKESGDVILSDPGIAEKVIALPTPLSSSPSFLAFNKSSGKGDLLVKFNAALAQMKSDQSMDKLVKSILGAK